LASVDGVSLLNAPPLSVLLDQQLIENETKSSDGEKKKSSYVEQHLFSVSCAATPERLTLFPIDVVVHLDSPIAGMSASQPVLLNLVVVNTNDCSHLHF